MRFYLGIDLGTSYFKAGIFDKQGNLVGLGRSYVDKRMNDRTICELPLVIFWSTLCDCVSQAIKKANIAPKEIVSLSYSSQANSFVLLDENDKPLTPLILWPDKRAVKIPIALKSLIEGHDFQRRTGLGILPGIQSMMAKIVWFQENKPEIWNKARSIMSISDYLTFYLTGQKLSDFSTASMMGLFDVTKEKWWEKALETLKIDKDFLNKPKRTGSYVGTLTEKGAQRLGLELSTKFFLGGLDHHMVAIGADLPNSKNISESTGTVLACVNYQNKNTSRNGINIAPGLKDGFYFQMAFNENGATALEWYQKNYASELSISELLKMAEDIEPNSNGLIALPCVDKSEGLSGFQNIKKEHSHGHFVRAILESTSRSLNELIKNLDSDNESEAIVSSGGGAQSPLWMGIKANILNKIFVSLSSSELACFGAASVGAMGVSQHNTKEDIFEKRVNYSRVITPDPVIVEKYKMNV